MNTSVEDNYNQETNKCQSFVGMRVGKITVIGYEPSAEHKGKPWLCRCDCGRTSYQNKAKILHGNTKPCECEQKKIKPQSLHKKYKRLSNIWRSMRQRCCYPKRKDYHSYGGRGIKVCDEWRNNFEAFVTWALNNGYVDTLSIDRINNDEGYFPENCRWATRREQDHNRPNTKLYIVRGEEYTLREICEILEVDPKAIKRRMKKGMDLGFATMYALMRRKVPWDGKKDRERRNERRKINRAKKKNKIKQE